MGFKGMAQHDTKRGDWWPFTHSKHKVISFYHSAMLLSKMSLVN